MLSNEYKLFDFNAGWCSPSKTMAPIIKEAIKSVDNVELIVVDVDKEPDLARTFKVRSIPMLVLVKDDEVIKTMVGLRSVKEVKEFLQVN
jgi:thioredoxin 1